MSEMTTLSIEAISDDVLMERMYEIACTGHGDIRELDRLDSVLYGRFIETYSDNTPDSTQRTHGPA